MTLRTAQMLRRFSVVFAGQRMPDNISELAMTEQQMLQDADPELFSLLSNQAPAELELAAMTGELADFAITPQQRQDTAVQAEVQQLIASSPFGTKDSYSPEGEFIPGKKENFTAQMRLSMLSEDAYNKCKAEIQPDHLNILIHQLRLRF